MEHFIKVSKEEFDIYVSKFNGSDVLMVNKETGEEIKLKIVESF